MDAAVPLKNGRPDSPVSTYRPTKAEKDLTARVRADFTYARDEQNVPRRYFNDRSLIETISDGHKLFNSYVPPRSDDPDESWRAQTVRPLIRNKIISIASHVTASVLYPAVFAQNRGDREDREAAKVMRDLMEWAAETSGYSRSFVRAAIQGLIEPATILKSEYRVVRRTVRDHEGNEREIVDEDLSGFDAENVPCKELLIANFSEPNIQRQRFLIRSRYIDHEEARMVYGKHKNFKHVRAGVCVAFDVGTDTFYEVSDPSLQGRLDHEVTYMSKFDDLEVCFLNGVLVTDPDRPNPRDDKRYPYASAVHEPLGTGQCFYGKSAVEKLRSDQEVTDTLYNMILDGTYLQLVPPMAVYGQEEVDASVYRPGTSTGFRDPNTKVESLAPRSDIRGGMEAIGLVERSMSESSQSSSQAGIVDGGEMTARQALILQQNARIALGLYGKQVVALVEDFGELRLAEILQHLTAADVYEIDGEAPSMSYRSFVLPNRAERGARVTKRIEFSEKMLGSGDGEVDMDEASYDVLEDEGGMDSETRISRVNPEEFRKMKFRLIVGADELEPRSKAIEKALDLEAYDRAIQSPYADQEMVAREFLFEVFRPGESARFIKKPEPAVGGEVVPPQGSPANTSMLSQVTGSNSLGVAASTDLGGTAVGSMSGTDVTA